MSRKFFTLIVLLSGILMFSITNSCKNDNNGCTAPPSPVPNSNSPVRVGDTIRLGCSVVPGATYNWTGPNGFSSTTREPKIGNASTAMAGDYFVTATVGGCKSAARKITIQIFSLKSVSYLGGSLIVYPEDNDPAAGWNNSVNLLTNATNDALGGGNTSAIVGAQGPGVYAAYICYNLVAFGYSDWYLPSKDELAKMYDHRVFFGGFTNEEYWSSTESTLDNAWYQDFTDGWQDTGTKFNGFRVRCVRRQ